MTVDKILKNIDEQIKILEDAINETDARFAETVTWYSGQKYALKLLKLRIKYDVL